MQINPSLAQQPEVVREVPARLLAAVSEGHRVEATVLARLSANTIRIQVGESQYQINSRQNVQPGQTLQLERVVENGRPVIRISAATLDSFQPAALLRQGQQMAVEVIKVLAQNRLLVTPTLTSPSPAQPGNGNTSTPRLPAQIEVDISQVKQSFRPGERLALEVLREQPLAVQLKAGSPTRAELIQQYQRDLLPQFNRSAPALRALNQLPAEMTLSQPIRQSLSQLMQGLSERQNLQQADGLRQALNNSGLFLESRLKSASTQTPLGQDLKANLLQLAQQLRTELAQPAQTRVLDNPALMQKLPVEVQTALRQLVSTPQELKNLPAQVPPALASRGQTPMQLLLGLLSGLAGQTTQSPSPNSPASPSANLTGVQAFIQAREMAAAPAQQAAIRAAEWQILRELLREVESASARIQFNQLSMLRDPDNPSTNNVWLFDLPVKDKQQLEMLQMRLEQHKGDKNSGDEAIWQVQLNLETQNLGPMQARINLHQQNVQVVLLAERQESSDMLSRYIDELNQRLDKLGVNVSHLSCRQAPITPLTIEPEPGLPRHLLDISV